jgi:threonine aldolase
VNLLQSRVADLTGKEAALFCSSGTLSNQLGIRTHLIQPPYSVLCDKQSHVYVYEAGGISFHNGAQVIPVDTEVGKTYLTEKVVKEHLIVDDDVHHCPTRLVCLENTKHGQIFPLQEQQKIAKLTKSHNIPLHLDGARIWNASVATGHSIQELCEPFDSVSLCFSKGLGAPVGSVLVGSHSFIRKAKHFRKLYGGGMRQVGLLAAACLYCLDNHFPNMKLDHENAEYLQHELQKLGFELIKPRETNMVWVNSKPLGYNAQQLCDHLESHRVRIFGGQGYEIRLVVHHQVTRQGIQHTIDVLQKLLHKQSSEDV